MTEESNGTMAKEEQQQLEGKFISARRLQTMLNVKGFVLVRDNKTKVRDAKFDMLEYVQEWLYREVSMMESLEMGMGW